MTATLTGGSKENEPGSLRDNIRAMPGPAGVLFAGTFINRLGTFIPPFIVIYLTHWGFSAPQAGLAVASYALGALIRLRSTAILRTHARCFNHGVRTETERKWSEGPRRKHRAHPVAFLLVRSNERRPAEALFPSGTRSAGGSADQEVSVASEAL